jgi:Fur family transcriptional regulator, ferric uptake regulator
MTVASDAPPLAFANLEQAVSALRERGLRLSSARRLLLATLFAADRPISAEQVAAHSGLDLASTYRNLETLERHGLARHVHFGHGPGLYVLVGRGEREYLFCERCREVLALEPERLDPVRDRISELFGYRARFRHFTIVGTCARCSANRSEG